MGFTFGMGWRPFEPLSMPPGTSGEVAGCGVLLSRPIIPLANRMTFCQNVSGAWTGSPGTTTSPGLPPGTPPEKPGSIICSWTFTCRVWWMDLGWLKSSV